MSPKRIFNLLLKLYPRAFREKYGEEMSRVFQESLHREGSSLQFWVRIGWDVISSALVESARSRTPRPLPRAALLLVSLLCLYFAIKNVLTSVATLTETPHLLYFPVSSPFGFAFNAVFALLSWIPFLACGVVFAGRSLRLDQFGLLMVLVNILGKHALGVASALYSLYDQPSFLAALAWHGTTLLGLFGALLMAWNRLALPQHVIRLAGLAMLLWGLPRLLVFHALFVELDIWAFRAVMVLPSNVFWVLLAVLFWRAWRTPTPPQAVT